MKLRFFISLIPLLFLVSPALATFTVVQHVANNSCTASSTSCTLTVSSTGAGHIILIGYAGGSSKTITGVSGGGTYTHCTACTGSNVNGEGTDISYTLASTSGTTSIVVSYTVTPTPFVEMVELSFTGSSVALDFGANVDNTTNTLRGGAVLSSATGTNDAVYQVISTSGVITISAISSPYTSFCDCGTTHGFGVGINTTTFTAPTWTFSGNAQSAGSGIAISETTGGAVTNKPHVQLF
jgi:hypothetical protein